MNIDDFVNNKEISDLSSNIGNNFIERGIKEFNITNEGDKLKLINFVFDILEVGSQTVFDCVKIINDKKEKNNYA